MKSAARFISGRDPASKLQRAVVRYVESRGGSIVVVGGIGLIRGPRDNFTISVDCTGTAPKSKKEKP